MILWEISGRSKRGMGGWWWWCVGIGNYNFIDQCETGVARNKERTTNGYSTNHRFDADSFRITSASKWGIMVSVNRIVPIKRHCKWIQTNLTESIFYVKKKNQVTPDGWIMKIDSEWMVCRVATAHSSHTHLYLQIDRRERWLYCSLYNGE